MGTETFPNAPRELGEALRSGTKLSRRAALALGTGLAMAGLSLHEVLGQDATPETAPGGASEGTPEAEAAGAEFPVATPLGDAIPPEFTAAETNWPAENLDLKANRNVLGSQISSSTIDQLGVAWNLPVNIGAPFGALVANPVVAGDLLFQQDAQSNVYAINKTTGEVVWYNEYNDAVPSGGPNGVGLGYGHAFYTLGGSAIVVAAKQDTGEEVWRADIRGFRDEGITMAPLVYDSTVYISTIPGTPEAFYNGGQRGFIFALEAASGKVLWYFDTTTDNLWNNARVNSGGGLWHVPSIDDEGNIYVGIGNAAPYPGTPEHPNATSRLGDNNYADSLLRINPETASIDWYINVKPHDLFDLDNQLTPVITNLDINGADTTVVFSSGKHGIVVAANAETGAELWRTPVGQHENDDTQEIPEGQIIKVLPGTLGGVETSMAYANGVLFTPIVNLPTYYGPDALDASQLDIFGGTGELTALNGATGEILWTAELPSPAYGAATVINDLVFTAALDGYVRAFNVADGSAVWEWLAPAGINATLGASGDYLFVPAGGPIITADGPGGTPAPNLIALTIGGTGTIAGAEASPEAGATPVAGGGATAVTINAIDIAWDQTELSIPAGTDVTVTVNNTGVLQHDFVIDELSVKTDLLNGGQSADVTINAPAGTYTYYCSVPGHREAGMQGTLTVA